MNLVDFGDDMYTDGRPHPMIEPSIRDRWIVESLHDPLAAVVLFDVVLGLGAHRAPVAGLVALLRDTVHSVPLVAYVCGTDLDPQNRGSVIRALTEVGVAVADSNAEAVAWAADRYRRVSA